jgi:transcriptional regulator with XRE-family HTH domain
MLDVLEFKAAMVRKGYTQKDLAKALGLSEKTFGERLKRKTFGSDEIEKLITILNISDPMPIFFSNVVTCKVTDAKECE